jgi:hypothetical protein
MVIENDMVEGHRIYRSAEMTDGRKERIVIKDFAMYLKKVKKSPTLPKLRCIFFPLSTPYKP